MSGVLVCVVGPSGAGKDTLIDGASIELAGDERFVFARRIVTRESSAAEDHHTVSPAEFQRLAAAGSFALAWEAHGLHYALPGALRDDLAASRVVVCNISRQALAEAHRRFRSVKTILVTAPMDVIAGRLVARGREDDAGRDSRTRREEAIPTIFADFRINNVGDVASNVAKFVRLLRSVRDESSSSMLGCWAR